MNQIGGDETEETSPIMPGRVDAENLVEPETRIGQAPESQQNVNETKRGENNLP
jgi:hypothetical protein